MRLLLLLLSSSAVACTHIVFYIRFHGDFLLLEVSFCWRFCAESTRLLTGPRLITWRSLLHIRYDYCSCKAFGGIISRH